MLFAFTGCSSPLQPPTPCPKYKHQSWILGMGHLPQHSWSCSWHGQHPQRPGRAGRAGLSPVLGFASLPVSCDPPGQASLGAHGSGAKEEISNWVWSGWKAGRKESSGQPLINLTAAGARAGLPKESPGPCCAHHGVWGYPSIAPAHGEGRAPLTFSLWSPVHFHSALILPFFSFIYIAICSLSFHLSPGESCQNLTTER